MIGNRKNGLMVTALLAAALAAAVAPVGGASEQRSVPRAGPGGKTARRAKDKAARKARKANRRTR